MEGARTSAPCCATTVPTRCATTPTPRWAGLAPLSQYHAAMLHTAGAADLLDGDLERADINFARALDEASSVGLLPFIPVVLAKSSGIVAAALAVAAGSRRAGPVFAGQAEHCCASAR